MIKSIPLAVRKHYANAPQPQQETMLEMRKRVLELARIAQSRES